MSSGDTAAGPVKGRDEVEDESYLGTLPPNLPIPVAGWLGLAEMRDIQG